ncbi:hypothetical protein LINGRAHAP2_LOCUS16749 [Linum grandiflorum]
MRIPVRGSDHSDVAKLSKALDCGFGDDDIWYCQFSSSRWIRTFQTLAVTTDELGRYLDLKKLDKRVSMYAGLNREKCWLGIRGCLEWLVEWNGARQPTR